MLALPQYLLLTKFGLTNSYWSVLLPFIMLSDENKFPITVGLFTLLNRGSSAPALYSLVVTGSLLSIIPLIILFLALQRYWRTDIASGAVKQ